MLRPTLTTLVFLLLATVAFAEPPKAVITGPTEGVPGDLIELDSSESIGSKMKWYVEPARFADGKATFKLSKDGTAIWLASRPQIYRVELIVSNEERPDRAVFTVTITGGVTPAPAPAPGPGPAPPAPGPAPLPAGRFGLAEFTRNQILSNVPTDKRGLCSAFSANYSNVATQIAAGTVKSLADANAKLKTMNGATAGAALDWWKANVFMAVIARQNELAKAGTLNTSALDDIQAALSEIATGFAAGANP